MITKQQLDIIDKKQLERQEQFRSVPLAGAKIKYLDKDFLVFRNVFSPFDDSLPLVENYQIKPGEKVLDVCTSSGVIAIFSALKGAGKVLAVDINPEAVKNAQANVDLYGLKDVIEVRLSDMFSSLSPEENFDVITGNLPFRNKEAPDLVAVSQWDTNLHCHKAFFEGIRKHLKPGGRVYLAQANFGALDEMKEMARKEGFKVKLIGQRNMPNNDPRIFYAFELS
ncbi:MAG: tRNA (adenine(22)-N(1))-methyltransferase TrmK [Candidatus Pacebacteria bacterium]|nr:tRNA (adenine(22)-N(1))-methyltransferase TrmK [Candidatus Paceibacterota bacterium]